MARATVDPPSAVDFPAAAATAALRPVFSVAPLEIGGGVCREGIMMWGYWREPLDKSAVAGTKRDKNYEW